jgi:hypothetical protein
MFDQSLRTRAQSIVALLLAVTVIGACASLPPTKPIMSMGEVAGRWEGTAMGTQGGQAAAKSTINADGSGVIDMPTVAPGRFPMQYQVQDGKLRYVSQVTGNRGGCTLHEGEGKRILSCRNDNGTTSEWTPAK